MERKLERKWFSQRDSMTRQGGRMCDSSTHAMYLYSRRPELAKDPNFMKGHAQFDDAWLESHVMQYGDTTNPHAQVRAMQDYGVELEFRETLGQKDIISQVDKGFGLRVAILIHDELGNLDPECGHWMWLVGYRLDKDALLTHVIAHDPAGDLDLIGGGYSGPQNYVTVNGKEVPNGAYRLYSWENFKRRWLCNSAGVYVGGNTGWGTLAKN